MTKKLTPKTKVLGASQNRGAILVQNNVAIIFLSSTPKIALVILYLSNGRTRHTIPNVPMCSYKSLFQKGLFHLFSATETLCKNLYFD